MNWLRWMGLILLLGVCLPSSAAQRIALVIGNDNYQNSPKLVNARNDARAVAAKLQSLGFTVVGGGPQLDANRQQMLTSIRQFAVRLETALPKATSRPSGLG